MKRRATAGFSLIELLVVVAIVSALAGIAIPMTLNAMKGYRLNAAVASATGAIQSTRYLAIMQGCPYYITFTVSTNSYQVTNAASCTTSYVGPKVPISRLGDVTLSRTFTYTLNANGTIQEGTGLPGTFTIANGIVTELITFTGVGNVTVSP